MALAAFMQIKTPDVKGISKFPDKGWIRLDSFSHGINQHANAVAAASGSGTQGETDHADFSVSKAFDLSSPSIAEHCSHGTQFKSVVIKCYSADGKDGTDYLTITLDQPIISHVSYSASDGSQGPAETLTFNYVKIGWNFKQGTTDDIDAGNQPGGWDLWGKKTWSAPA